MPEGYEVIDVGDQWLMPGMVDLHCHVGGHLRHQRHGLPDQPRSLRGLDVRDRPEQPDGF